MTDVVAVVPARGGSRGVPRKNVAPVGGRPLIAWTIDAARASGVVRRVVVTTDDDAIADAAREAGAEVPFARPAALARDDTPGIEPLIHAVEWLAAHDGDRPERILLLQPTSPLRAAEDVRSAVALAATQRADAVVSVTEAPCHPWWVKRVGDDGRLRPWDEGIDPGTHRQQLPPAYALNGAIYLIRREVLLARRTLHPADTVALVMPAERSLDIDTPFDLRLADLLLTARSDDVAA